MQLVRRAPLALALLAALTPLQAGTLPDADFKALKKRVAQLVAAGDPTPGPWVEAIQQLGGDDSERAVELLEKLALEPSVPLPGYMALRQALAGMGSDEAVAAMISRVEKRSGDARLKIVILDAFATRTDPRSAEALGAALQARQPEVVRAALNGLKARRPREAVPALFDLLERTERNRAEADGLIANQTREVLQAITGAVFDNVEDWRKQWEIVKDQQRVVTGDMKAAPGGTSERKRPTFFGTEIRSNRVVFVIDISGSMTDGDRIGKAKEQLKGVIEALDDRARFTIIAFSNQCRIWKDSLQAASPANKQDATRFVDALQAMGNTLTLTAMRAALEMSDADAIVLLSDGFPTETAPNGAPMEADGVAAEITQLNRFKRWRIDTFGFAGLGSVNTFMINLARMNGGTYTDIK